MMMMNIITSFILIILETIFKINKLEFQINLMVGMIKVLVLHLDQNQKLLFITIKTELLNILVNYSLEVMLTMHKKME